jgi:diguanylate cyclase (GGDEF)-like protein
MRRFKRYLICVDNELNIVKNDNAFLSYLGMKELHNLSQIIPPPDFMQLQNCMFAISYGKTNLTCFRVRSGNGGLDWFAANINKPENPEEPIQIELSDIQTMKSGSTDSYYDKMTGLYNKNTITDYAMNLMQSKDHSPFYFFLMDIDNFKSVNDTFGHMKGDEIITDVAHIAKEFVGDNGVVGRIGGDEFMLVLENVSTEHDLRIILKNIRKTVEEKYQDMGNNVCVTVSMGGALFPEDAFDYESMFTLADKMLYLAKTKGRNRYVFYSPLIHGKMHFDKTVMTVSQSNMMNQEKSSMMIDLLDKLIVEKSFDTKQVLEQLLSVYVIDEVHMVDADGKTSYYGLQRNTAPDGSISFDHNVLETPIVGCDELKDKPDSSPIAVFGFNLNRELMPHIADFMKMNDLRVMVIYHMKTGKRPGYIMFMNHTQSTCRLSLTDLTDITYVSHMIEISGQC